MKIFKLFVDENIKTWKKFSTKLLLIIVILSLFGTLGITKLMQKLDSRNQYVVTEVDDEEYYRGVIKSLENQLKNENLDEESKESIKQEIERNKLLVELKVSAFGNYNWKREISDQVVDNKMEKNDEKAEQLLKLVKENDFHGYIELKKEDLKKQLENKEIEKEEYDDTLIILNLKEKYEVGTESSENNYWKTAAINEIEAKLRTLRTGMNQETRRTIKVEEKAEIESEIKILNYRLENNIPDANYASDTNFRIRFEMLAPMFSMAIISIVVIVIAGGTISSEIANGTIKFWALTPNKRWKILTAKLLSILFYIVVITLIASLLSIFIANIFFNEQGDVYLYVKNGEVNVINNTLYTVETYFARAIPVVVFALFAVMLSTITRNTAVAVSISEALYVGNGIVMAILNQFIKKDWIRFVPFNNLDIVHKIFKNSVNIMETESTFATSTTLTFSLAVLGVCSILMIVTMYDSFNKRDII